MQIKESWEWAKGYAGRRVLVTGHTGFKGSWLCQWLCELGAQVSGFARDPLPESRLFDQLFLSGKLVHDLRAELSDFKKLESFISEWRPEFIFHMAAQPLVRLSYEEPIETFSTNILGTAHLLEAVRVADYPCQVVVITTDKCYQNKEWLHAYRENDPMGGHDPYSASKGCAELVADCYRNAYFLPKGLVRMATARAGNVIGGGDWAQDRIVPDCLRALKKGEKIAVRNRTATRPWQHVLEPLSGYLRLGMALEHPEWFPISDLSVMASAFNFGPNTSSNRTVAELVSELLNYLPGEWIDASDPHAPHEASKLNLAIEKAFHVLGWQPRWNFERTIQETALWYKADLQDQNMEEFTKQQIQRYCQTKY